MSAWTLIGILIVIGILLGTAGLFYMQYDFRKKAKGCVCVTFTGPLKCYDELWPVEGNIVKPPESHLAKLPASSKVKKQGYYILPEGPLPSVSWPLWGWPAAFGTEVKRVFYTEGDPRPQPKHDSAPLYDATTFAKLIKSQSARSFTADVERHSEDPLAHAGGIVKASYFWIMTGSILVGVVVTAILAYMAYANSGTYW